MRWLRRRTKKERLARLLAEHGGRLPLGVAARELYGRDGELERLKVVRLLAAYRARGAPEGRYRVRGGYVVPAWPPPRSSPSPPAEGRSLR